MKMEFDLKTIDELTRKDKKNQIERALKLAEETGEVAEAVLSLNEAGGCGYKGKTEEDVIEECLDVILVALSIISGIQEEAVQDHPVQGILNMKIDKWKNRM